MAEIQRNDLNPQTFFKTTVIIHAALLIGQVLFGIVAFSITNNAVMNTTPGKDIFFYLVPLLIVFGVFMGGFLYKQTLAKQAENATLHQKLAAYQRALITRCALSEGASLFGIVVFLVTGNLVYLLFTGLNIIYFIWIRPTKQKMEDDLNLAYEEKADLG